MAVDCGKPYFLFPFYADIYYATISQGGYGEVKKAWIFDRTILCNASPYVGRGRQNMKPSEYLKYENELIAKSKIDIRSNASNQRQALTNILITNIRDVNDNLIYKETAGPRSGQGTLFEIATLEPFVGPFQNIEHYKMLWRKTENQSLNSL